MSKIAIVTDSTSYLPQEFIEDLNITVIPQVLVWDGKTILDGVDITPVEFYERLEIADVMPTTSQATVGDFKNIFKPLVAEGFEILAILVSGALSGTVSSATQARELFPGARIEIVDSMTISMELGFIVLAAARAAKEGATIEECIALAETTGEKTGLLFAVETLEFLHRGGRIGGAKKFLGSVLKMKPILEVTGGVITPLEQVRTSRKAIQRLLDIVDERIDGRGPVKIGILHANAEAKAKDVLFIASGMFNPTETILTDVSPVVGTHAGPGTIGIAYQIG